MSLSSHSSELKRERETVEGGDEEEGRRSEDDIQYTRTWAKPRPHQCNLILNFLSMKEDTKDAKN